MNTITNRNEPCPTRHGGSHVWPVETVSADYLLSTDRCVYCQGLFHKCETDRPAWAADERHEDPYINRLLHQADVEELNGLPHDELVALILHARYELSI